MFNYSNNSENILQLYLFSSSFFSVTYLVPKYVNYSQCRQHSVLIEYIYGTIKCYIWPHYTVPPINNAILIQFKKYTKLPAQIYRRSLFIVCAYNVPLLIFPNLKALYCTSLNKLPGTYCFRVENFPCNIMEIWNQLQRWMETLLNSVET